MENTAKRTYRKPEVVRVNLNPQEAILGVCRTGDVQDDCLLGEPTASPLG